MNNILKIEHKSRNGRFARHAGNGFPVSDDGRPLSVFKREIGNKKTEIFGKVGKI